MRFDMLGDIDKSLLNEMGITAIGDCLCILKHAKLVHSRTMNAPETTPETTNGRETRATLTENNDKQTTKASAAHPSTSNLPGNLASRLNMTTKENKTSDQTSIANKSASIVQTLASKRKFTDNTDNTSTPALSKSTVPVASKIIRLAPKNNTASESTNTKRAPASSVSSIIADRYRSLVNRTPLTQTTQTLPSRPTTAPTSRLPFGVAQQRSRSVTSSASMFTSRRVTAPSTPQIGKYGYPKNILTITTVNKNSPPAISSQNAAIRMFNQYGVIRQNSDRFTTDSMANYQNFQVRPNYVTFSRPIPFYLSNSSYATRQYFSSTPQFQRSNSFVSTRSIPMTTNRRIIPLSERITFN